MSSWLKGGIIAGVFFSITGYFATFSDVMFSIGAIIIIPSYFILATLTSILGIVNLFFHPGGLFPSPNFFGKTLMVVVSFGIGALVGLIIEKIKNKNGVKNNER